MPYPLHEYDTEDDDDDEDDEEEEDMKEHDPDDHDKEEHDEERRKRPSKHPSHTATDVQDTSKPTKAPFSLRSPHVTTHGGRKGHKGGKGSPRKSPGSPRLPSGGGSSGDQVLFTQREILALRLMFSLFDRSGLVSQ